MYDQATQLRDSIAVKLSSAAGAEYTTLKYLNPDLLSKNSFTSGHDKRHGVRPSFTTNTEDSGVSGMQTYRQTFEVVLTKGYSQSGVSDTAKYDAFLELHEIALQFNAEMIRTRAGSPSIVLNVQNLNIDEPQFLDDKVAVLTGTVEIIYRVTL
jgi:hypothetical protein